MLTIARWVKQTSVYLNQLGERFMGSSQGFDETNRPLKENEVELSNTIPAVFSNRFYIAMGAGGVRITFAEQQSENSIPMPRNAVIMHPEDGIALYKSLQGLLVDFESALQKHKESQQEEK